MTNRTSDKVSVRIFKYHGGNSPPNYGGNSPPNKSQMLPYHSTDVQNMIRRLFGGVGILLECTHKCVVEFMRAETHDE